MSTTKYLIVNGDDFGQSHGVNEGIIECFENGILTSASLMVRWPAAVEAAEYARSHPDLSVGLHVDLGEWQYLDGEWYPLYEVVSLEDEAAVRLEVTKQLDVFAELMGKSPSHLDSHQHVHLRESSQIVMDDLYKELGLPLRAVSGDASYCGGFFGFDSEGRPNPAAVSVDGLVRLLTNLSARITEMACHPSTEADLNTMYNKERKWEVETLTDDRVKDALRRLNVRLCSFSQLRSISTKNVST